MADFDPEDAVQLLRTMTLHVNAVQRGMQAAAHALERRALIHDQSKLLADEFAAFSRINRAAREHPYGSEEYRAGLRAEKETIDRHYERNSHHPEHTLLPATGMSWLDVVEMVCDWRSAYRTYGSQGTWEENLDRQRERYGALLSPAQWWLIDQVSTFLLAEGC